MDLTLSFIVPPIASEILTVPAFSYAVGNALYRYYSHACLLIFLTIEQRLTLVKRIVRCYVAFMANTEKKRVVGYIRVSTNQQAEEGISLDAQRAKLQAYAVAMDFDLISIEMDAGLSAASLARPGVQKALQMIKSGQADALLVVKQDRLSRSMLDMAKLIKSHFQDAQFISIAEQFDTHSASGRMFVKMMTLFSEYERELIGERTRDALAHLRAQGVQMGTAALGWDHGTKDELNEAGRRRIFYNDKELEIVDLIVELRDQGQTLRAIAAHLSHKGCKTKRGGRWQANTIRKVLIRARGERLGASS